MEIIRLKTSELTPYEKNAKLHPQEQIDQIKNSIQQFGMNDPIAIWGKKNIVVEGHGRLLALEQLGIDEVDCIRLDHLTDDERRAYTIAHNSTNMSSGFDFDILEQELADLDFDFSDFGLDDIGGNVQEKEAEEDNFDVESAIPGEPKAKYGDVYILGSHRLVCGDSTKEEDVAKLMNGKLADLVITDPPYNVEYDGNKNPNTQNDFNCGENRKIQNDKMQDDDFTIFLIRAFSNMNENIKDGGSFYIWHADSEGANFRNACNEVGWKVRQCLIWVKNRIMMGRQDYQWKHEPCLYGWKEGASHYFIDDRTQSTVFEDKGIDIKKLKKEEMLKLLQDIYSDKISTSIIHEDRPSRSDLHPTMKPIKLLARLIKNSSKKEESVLDLFGGSGSTLIACEQLNRSCYMMELDPKYVDVIIARWEQFTGQKATKLN